MSEGGSVRPARRSDDERIAELERRLGVALTDRRAALAALTHASYLNERRGLERDDNERLEFLGDAVVSLVISHRLMERLPRAHEGDLSKTRASLVDEEALAALARELDLGSLLLLGRGEELSGGREKPSLLADTFEAVFGAIYLSGGLPAAFDVADRIFRGSLERAVTGGMRQDAKTELQQLADRLLRDALDRALSERAVPEDAKSAMQRLADRLFLKVIERALKDAPPEALSHPHEAVQRSLKSPLRYHIVSAEGPSHSKTFVIEAAVAETVIGRGSGRSKKDAEQAAAREALLALEQELVASPVRSDR